MTASQGPAPHIIIADDEVIAAIALERYLARKGFRVSIAAHGLEALDIHGQDPADLLVTDVRMPRLTGTELVRRLRLDRPDLPVIVATGYMSGESDLPQDDRTIMMSKPLDPQELLTTLRALLGDAGAAVR